MCGLGEEENEGLPDTSQANPQRIPQPLSIQALRQPKTGHPLPIQPLRYPRRLSLPDLKGGLGHPLRVQTLLRL